MEDRPCLQFFLEPQQTFHRQYEALRAIVVGGEPLKLVAERFGYKVLALKSMACRFRASCRRGITPPFFSRTVEDDLQVNVRAQTTTALSCQRLPTAENCVWPRAGCSAPVWQASFCSCHC
jgi:hypothetical protein